jgi:hypothetical protein
MPPPSKPSVSRTRIYPEYKDPDFGSKWLSLRDIQTLAVPEGRAVLNEKTFDAKAKEYCEGYEKFLYQYIAQQYLSPHSPYQGLLMFHGLGFGKTCSAITFAEAWLEAYAGMEQSVWVITSNALIDNFKGQLYRRGSSRSQCLGDTYKSLWMGAYGRSGASASEDSIQKFIERRYTFYTYERFGSLVAEKAEKGELGAWAKNRILIVDEAHNLRNPTIRGAIGLETFLKVGNNNRLILMSATPMFDQPNELFQLFYYLALNDRRNDLGMSLEKLQKLSFYNKQGELQESVMNLVKKLCANYISYVKGRNPFLLAARLNPTVNGIGILERPPSYGYFESVTGEGEKAESSGSKKSSKWLHWIPDGLVPSVLSPVQTEALTSHLYAKENAKQKMRRKGGEDTEDDTRMPINTNVLEATNIVYPVGATGKTKKSPFQVGSDGFLRILKEVPLKGASRNQYEYYDKPYLFPNETYLKTYSAKLHRVAELIQQAEGIVMIYSHFIWSGLMPMALVLEHLGYTPYQEEPYLYERKPVAATTDIPITKGRHYAVFCSDSGISGVDGFPKKLEAINDPRNANGENIKVILMSPVASEGISFSNVREVHILDPWFHFNRLEQVIGRSIRTCSHKGLALAQRNVVVYLHVAQYPATSPKRHQETYDVYAYHLAADKKQKTDDIERVIRDHALDCAIQRHLNYYPKHLFPFDVRFLTAQKKEVYWRLGDDAGKEPKCVAKSTVRQPKMGRKETYAPLRAVGKERLWKYVSSMMKKQKVMSWPLETLWTQLQLPKEIALLALEDFITEWNQGTEGSRLTKHRNQLWLEPIPDTESYRPVQIHIQSFGKSSAESPEARRLEARSPEARSPEARSPRAEPKEKPEAAKPEGTLAEGAKPEGTLAEGAKARSPRAEPKEKPEGTLAEGVESDCAEMVNLLLNDENYSDYEPITMVMFLTLLNITCWDAIAQRIVRENIQSRLTKALWKEGWIIRADEFGESSSQKWAGYCQIDLLKNDTDLEIRLYEATQKEWRDATRAETVLLKKNRNFQEPPAIPYGFYTPDIKSKSFKFKLLQETVGKRVKTGIVATTLPIPQLHQLLESLKETYLTQKGKPFPVLPNFEGKKGASNYKNRAYLASWIAYYMGLMGRLRIPPFYKISG